MEIITKKLFFQRNSQMSEKSKNGFGEKYKKQNHKNRKLVKRAFFFLHDPVFISISEVFSCHFPPSNRDKSDSTACTSVREQEQPLLNTLS